MRDIRQDLQERLDALASDRTKLQARIEAISALENSVKAMLREEEVRIARLSVNRAELPFPAVEHGTNIFLGSLIKRIMKAKNRPLATDEIRDEIVSAKAYDFGEKKPGRVVHFGLVSLSNGREIERLPDGRWRFPLNGHAVPVQEAQPAQ